MPRRTVRTTCPMDCPDACALEVVVQGGRVQKIKGGRDHPDTAGFICSKVAGFHRRLEHEDRVLHPMRRVGAKGEGGFEPITWAEAVAEITRRFADIRGEWGGEAIVPFHYGGSNGLLTDDLLDDLFFRRLGASRLEKTICAAPTTEVARGMYGKMPTVAFEDFPRARCIVIWGANPKTSNIHLVPYLREAKSRGTFIAVVDPRRNFSDAEVDLHLPVLPGTDLPVALAMIDHLVRTGRLDETFIEHNVVELELLLEQAQNWSLERAAEVAGVPAQSIQQLAEIYADSEPALIRCGWGLERNRNGGQAVAAVLALPALLGKFGLRGGGYTMSNSGAYSFDRQQLLGEMGDETRSLNMTQLGRWLNDRLEPPVKALFVYNANPVATVPDQNAVLRGLSRPDLFTVVFEQVLTDTAAFADLLLPAVTFLEGNDLRGGYGSYAFGGIQPVIPAYGEARSNAVVFAELGRSMGWDDPPFHWSEEELIARAVDAMELAGRRPGMAELAEGRTIPVQFEGGTPVQYATVFPRTHDGKVHLAPEVLGKTPFRFLKNPVSGFPLALITPASSRRTNSTCGELETGRVRAKLHPDDAERRDIEPGDRVRVHNDLGELICLAEVGSAVRPGVVVIPKGAWRKDSFNGYSANALCPDHVNEVAGAACFNDARVEVEKA
ncbi:MAG: molybdopterin-dependent oxidoreductase [Thermoanaerobaculia bacterium]